MMRVENNNVSGQNLDPEQIDLIDLLVQLWRGKMTIIISVIVAIALAIGYLVDLPKKSGLPQLSLLNLMWGKSLVIPTR